MEALRTRAQRYRRISSGTCHWLPPQTTRSPRASSAWALKRGTQATPMPCRAMLFRLSAMAVSYTVVERRARWRSRMFTERPRKAPAL
ncbi:hypothetical protein D3C80_1867040 [compost metagenome]